MLLVLSQVAREFGIREEEAWAGLSWLFFGVAHDWKHRERGSSGISPWRIYILDGDGCERGSLEFERIRLVSAWNPSEWRSGGVAQYNGGLLIASVFWVLRSGVLGNRVEGPRRVQPLRVSLQINSEGFSFKRRTARPHWVMSSHGIGRRSRWYFRSRLWLAIVNVFQKQWYLTESSFFKNNWWELRWDWDLLILRTSD